MRFNKFIFIKILNYNYVKVPIKLCRENALLNFLQAGPSDENEGPNRGSERNIASILNSISVKGINDSKFNK